MYHRLNFVLREKTRLKSDDLAPVISIVRVICAARFTMAH